MQRATLVRQARALRSSPAPRRAASSTTEAGKEKASQAAEGAKKYIGQAGEQGSKVLNQLGERANSMLGSYSEPIVYNLSVLREVGKQVYIAEKLSPPTNPQVIRSAYEEIYNKASDASWWRSTIESGAWKKVAIYAVEAYGIFTIGEMIGRRHVVGYKPE